MRLVRREAVKALLCTAFSSRLGATGATIWGPGEEGLERRRQMLLSLFADLRPARSVGIAYTQTLPPAERMADRLSEPFLSLPSEMFDTIESLRSSIAARIRDDFAKGRVVCVDGWLLAASEARLCGLAAVTVQPVPEAPAGGITARRT